MAIIKSLHKSQKDGVPEEGSPHLVLLIIIPSAQGLGMIGTKKTIGKKNPPQRVQRPVTDKKIVGHNGKSDGKDDGFDHFYQSASSDKKTVGHNGKSDSNWTDGSFL
ncbi:hypothetical protein CsSME_00031547 [Camellia sinensis var. sinensis]